MTNNTWNINARFELSLSCFYSFRITRNNTWTLNTHAIVFVDILQITDTF